MNGALSIRVGGGFMNIEEFVAKHAERECNHLKSKMKKEKKNVAQVVEEMVKKYKYKQFTST